MRIAESHDSTRGKLSVLREREQCIVSFCGEFLSAGSPTEIYMRLSVEHGEGLID